MRIKILILGLIFLFAFPLIAKEGIVFESVLKDVDFSLLPPTIDDMKTYELLKRSAFKEKKDLESGLAWPTWWTLKFENGAVITIRKWAWPADEAIIWWIGKKYKVTQIIRKTGDYFIAGLVEEKKVEKKDNSPDS